MPGEQATSHNEIYEAIGQLRAEVRELQADVTRVDKNVTDLMEWKNKGRGGLMVLAGLITGFGVLAGIVFGIIEALK